MQKKNKAFTLTELLVVVIVLGVLAAVAVPKFTRVLETRKTTEAEEIFAAVRTEQENRCVFGKNYLTDKTQLAMLSGADNSGNYAYSLTGQGIVASSDKGYRLKMLSYKDGQICCEGSYCDSLNKSYPSCSAISVSADECAGEAVEPEPEPDPVYSCDESVKPSDSETCNQCGTRTRSVTCNTATGNWVTGSWRACNKTLTDCTGSACDPATKPADFQTACGCGQMTISYYCHEESGQWRSAPGSCVLPEGACQNGQKETRSCGLNDSGTQTRTCSNCAWGEWSECEGADSCPNGERSDGTCKEPVYKWKLVTKASNYRIPACAVNGPSASSCRSEPPEVCKTFKLTHGGTITSPAGGVFCADRTCPAGSAENPMGFTCIQSYSMTNDNNYKYCVYSLSECVRYIAYYE